jgi:hypothetical protein
MSSLVGLENENISFYFEKNALDYYNSGVGVVHSEVVGLAAGVTARYPYFRRLWPNLGKIILSLQVQCFDNFLHRLLYVESKAILGEKFKIKIFPPGGTGRNGGRGRQRPLGLFLTLHSHPCRNFSIGTG